MKSNSKHKAFALTKKGVALPITAALMTLIALFGITACPNNVEGGAVTDTANGGNTGGLEWHEAPLIEGGASLILSPDKLTIRVTVKTSDNSPITVEGCDKTELTSSTRTELNAKGRKVILKGKITQLLCDSNQLTSLNVQGLNALQYLYCDGNKLTELSVQGLNGLQTLKCKNNQLTALNVQGCTALEWLHCGSNQLNAEAFKKLFNDLPYRPANRYGSCYLYREVSEAAKGNHKDFASPGELKTAFDNAKTVKNWKMYKYDTNGHKVEI